LVDYDGDSDEDDVDDKVEASSSQPEATEIVKPKSDDDSEGQPEKRDTESVELPAAKRMKTEL
jgi:hypothetical protein